MNIQPNNPEPQKLDQVFLHKIYTDYEAQSNCSPFGPGLFKDIKSKSQRQKVVLL